MRTTLYQIFYFLPSIQHSSLLSSAHKGDIDVLALLAQWKKKTLFPRFIRFPEIQQSNP